MTSDKTEETNSKISNIYFDYPVVVMATDGYPTDNIYPIWLAIMGLQEAANSMKGVEIYDMMWHPKNGME